MLCVSGVVAPSFTESRDTAYSWMELILNKYPGE
jgi:hypothetical protein